MRYFIVVMCLICGCKTKNQSAANFEFIPDYSKGPPTLVYKTKSDYSELVPVLLSEDKMRIVAYPGKGDIQLDEGFPLPTALQDGYYLDNRGITRHVAFLKLTYEEYSNLETLPPVNEIYEWIIDKDPLTSLCDCGSRKVFTDIHGQLNALIKAKKLDSVCRLVM